MLAKNKIIGPLQPRGCGFSAERTESVGLYSNSVPPPSPAELKGEQLQMFYCFPPSKTSLDSPRDDLV